MAKTTVTMTNGELAAKQEALEGLLKISMVEPYYHQVVRLGKQLRDEIKGIGESYNRLVEKYGEKDADEKSPTYNKVVVKAGSPNREQFNAEHKALMAAKVDIEVNLVPLPPTLSLSGDIGATLFEFILWPSDEDAVTEAEKIVKGTGK